MSDAASVVFLVDDDAAVRKALARLIKSAGHCVETFGSARAFLDSGKPAYPHPACLVLDVHLPDLNGLELQRELAAARRILPVIFITGRGDIPTSVRAMKAGAADFLTKPVHAAELLEAIERALGAAVQAQEERMEQQAVLGRLASLTPREREVMERVVAGRLNKQIADELGTVEKTIKVHRARVMEKMQAASLAELVHIAGKAGVTGPGK
jgi:FixJ family two-component response regulator